MTDDTLKEAKRLHKLGWACHWLRPNSKAPVKDGWQKPTRDSWETLKADYKKGYGLGVKLGAASKINGHYLANIDIDIKSSKKRHRREAMQYVAGKFPWLERGQVLSVQTGYGLRLFVLTKQPVSSLKLQHSNELCKVLMPTQKITDQQKGYKEKGLITAKELNKGYRIRPAWEVEFMSIGKQVVLPPSIHPDTGLIYKWADGADVTDIPVLESDDVLFSDHKKLERLKTDFKISPVDIEFSNLSDEMILAIKNGTGVENRSNSCFSATMSMLRAGFSHLEIMTVLTDKRYFLGQVAYDHQGGTNSRAKAADWVNNQCIRKALLKTSYDEAFDNAVEVTPLITDPEKVAAQFEALSSSWVLKIKRLKPAAGAPLGAEGKPQGIVENIVLILTRAVGSNLFKRDIFARRDTYGIDAPWTGGTKDKPIVDDDIAHILLYLSNQWEMQTTTDKINLAVTIIATNNEFHPVRDELKALPYWDGNERLNVWLKKYFNAHDDEEYLAQVFRKWMVGSVTRIFNPGYKFDWMIIFEGEQGTGKSSFGSILCGQQYFRDHLPDLNSKDAMLGLLGNRVVEFSELDSMHRSQVDTTKAFVSRPIDKFRPPFAERDVELGRQCVFFGTTNRREYLKDDSGNRRFNPIKVGRLNFKALKRDKDQLWAEALFIYENRLEKDLDLTGTAEIYAKEIRLDKMVQDTSYFMQNYLAEFFKSEYAKINSGNVILTHFPLTLLFKTGIGPLQKFQEDQKNYQFAARALKNLGFEKRKTKGNNVWELIYRDRIPIPGGQVLPHPIPEATPR